MRNCASTQYIRLKNALFIIFVVLYINAYLVNLRIRRAR